MDAHWIKGAAKEIKGGVKDAVGRMIGDRKMQAEGKADKVAGRAQRAVGQAKDAAKETFKH